MYTSVLYYIIHYISNKSSEFCKNITKKIKKLWLEVREGTADITALRAYIRARSPIVTKLHLVQFRYNGGFVGCKCFIQLLYA